MNSRAAGFLLIAAAHLGVAACSSAPPARREPERREETPEQDPAAVAARISGDWQFAVDRGGQTTEGWLHFGLNAGVLVGSLTGADNNSREISKIALKGDKLSWRIETDSVSERYEGTLKGSSMEGTLKVSRKGGEGRRGGGSESEEGSGSRGGRGGYGGYGGRRGGFGRGGGGGRGASSEIKWRAYRSVQPTPAAAPEPTKPPVVS